jgi:hypothetical protein
MHHNVSLDLKLIIYYYSFVFLVAEITGHSIMSGAGFIIALGVIIIILSALGK